MLSTSRNPSTSSTLTFDQDDVLSSRSAIAISLNQRRCLDLIAQRRADARVISRGRMGHSHASEGYMDTASILGDVSLCKYQPGSLEYLMIPAYC